MTITATGSPGPNDARSIDAIRARSLDLGLLLLRVGAAALIWTFHMSRKLADIPGEMREFPDPLGVGHAASFVMALGAEGLCSVFVAIGLGTRLSSLPVVFTMAMVMLLGARGFQGADVQAALLYALPYAVLALTGAGRWSIDHRMRDRWDRVGARLAPRLWARHGGDR